ncbi:MAG: SDR family oxidoreductase [Hyphomicrobiaceae bacterium]|nr:SDR family oxidoreductase [Hyphomicrobiaceae bacterium]
MVAPISELSGPAPQDGLASRVETSASTARVAQGVTRPAVVVTGASDGIGLALARIFAKRGHWVVLVARDEQRLGEAVASVGHAAADGPQAIGIALDVTRDDAHAVLTDRLVALGLHVDVLVNNAGVGLGGDFASQSMEDLDRLVALNVASLTRMTRAAVADMRRRGHGTIINMASLGGYVPGPQQAAYYASKAYVLSLSEAVAHELRGSGIRVAVVAPGPVDTNFHAAMGADGAFYRLLLPSLSPDGVAASVYRGYRLGLRVIVPGITNRIMGIALRVLPHTLTVPLTAWLLRPRGGGRQ